MSRLAAAADLARVDFRKGGGLVPVVAQHATTGEVLMVGYADRDALAASLRDGELWLFSRARQALWRKGATSGNALRLVSLHADCDADAVVARVLPAGPTCHTGQTSCFAAPPTLPALAETIARRAAPEPEGEQRTLRLETTAQPVAEEQQGGGERPSYTRRLLADENLRLKKLGEEAVELALACRAGDPDRVASEAADLLYHLLVAAAAAGAPLAAVLGELERRRR